MNTHGRFQGVTKIESSRSRSSTPEKQQSDESSFQQKFHARNISLRDEFGNAKVPRFSNTELQNQSFSHTQLDNLTSQLRNLQLHSEKQTLIQNKQMELLEALVREKHNFGSGRNSNIQSRTNSNVDLIQQKHNRLKQELNQSRENLRLRRFSTDSEHFQEFRKNSKTTDETKQNFNRNDENYYEQELHTEEEPLNLSENFNLHTNSNTKLPTEIWKPNDLKQIIEDSISFLPPPAHPVPLVLDWFWIFSIFCKFML